MQDWENHENAWQRVADSVVAGLKKAVEWEVMIWPLGTMTLTEGLEVEMGRRGK